MIKKATVIGQFKLDIMKYSIINHVVKWKYRFKTDSVRPVWDSSFDEFIVFNICK